MKALKVDHIGIAVSNLEQAMKFYAEILGLKAAGVEVVEDQKVRVAFFPCGDSELELLESTSPDGPIAKFIEKNGEGIQHIAIRVENIDEVLEEFAAKGVRMIDQKPRYGAGDARIAFLHPKATGGVLLEISERK